MKYTIEFNDYVWECGDGCCTDYLTDIIVNGKEISTHSFMRCEKELKSVIEYVNNHQKDEYIFKLIPEKVSEDDYEYILYLDDLKLGDCNHDHFIVTSLLDDLGFKVTVYDYDFDYDKWDSDKVIILDNDVEISRYNYEK